MEDTKKELERLEKALLAEETAAVPFVEEDLTEDLPEDIAAGTDETLEAELLEEMPAEEPKVDESVLDALLAEVSGPAFDDPDALPETDETMVFRNFSNDFGADLTRYGEEEEEEEKTPEEKKRDDKIVIGLEIAACALCLGIIGILIYWLVAFL